MFRPFMLWTSRRALRWFYRAHRVVWEGAVPETGAVLLIGNHPNDLPDVLTGYLCTDRPVRYLATVSVAESWAARKTYAALDVIPVVRVRDARKLRKSGVDLAAIDIGATRSVVTALGRGQVVGAFPQGGVHDTPSVGRLRTGVAQMLLEYFDSGAEGDVAIVPFGIHYDAPDQPGSDAVCHVGQPFSLRQWVADYASPGVAGTMPGTMPGTTAGTMAGAGDGAAAELGSAASSVRIAALTDRLAEALRSVTRNANSWEDAERHNRLVAALSAASASDPLTASPAIAAQLARTGAHPMAASSDNTCRYAIAESLAQAVADAGGRANSATDHGLLRAGLGLTPCVEPTSGALLALAAPAAGLGWLLHVVPWRLVMTLARRLSTGRSDFAARAMVPGVFVMLAWYVVLSVLPLAAIGFTFWPLWLVMVWTLVPVSGDLALWWHRARRAANLVARVKRMPAAERERLREMAGSLTLPGSPPAEP